MPHVELEQRRNGAGELEHLDLAREVWKSRDGQGVARILISTIFVSVAAAPFAFAGCGGGGSTAEATIERALGDDVRNCRQAPAQTKKWKHEQSTFVPPVHDYFYDTVWRCVVPSEPGLHLFVLRGGKYYGER